VPDTLWCSPILLERAEVDAALGEVELVPVRLHEAAKICAHNGDRIGLAYCQEALRMTATPR
jgi:hypothetical protein